MKPSYEVFTYQYIRYIIIILCFNFKAKIVFVSHLMDRNHNNLS